MYNYYILARHYWAFDALTGRPVPEAAGRLEMVNRGLENEMARAVGAMNFKSAWASSGRADTSSEQAKKPPKKITRVRQNFPETWIWTEMETKYLTTNISTQT